LKESAEIRIVHCTYAHSGSNISSTTYNERWYYLSHNSLRNLHKTYGNRTQRIMGLIPFGLWTIRQNASMVRHGFCASTSLLQEDALSSVGRVQLSTCKRLTALHKILQRHHTPGNTRKNQHFYLSPVNQKLVMPALISGPWTHCK